MFTPRYWVLLLLSTLLSGSARCCSVPVFRYALERWPAEAYELAVLHRDPLTAEQKALLDQLKEFADGIDPTGNLQTRSVDIASKDDADAQLIKSQAGKALPWMVLRYPRSDTEMPNAWTGALSAENVAALKNSKTRTEIAARLLRGEAVVWLLIESTDTENSEKTATVLQSELEKLQKSLVLPDQNDGDNADVEAPLLRSGLPLKMAFSVVRLSRTDPQEHVFLSMLLNSEKGLSDIKEPIVVPIFGRGRALGTLTGKVLNVAHVGEAASFLTGACSCQVKELNPGFDLLIAANWDSIFEEKQEPLKSRLKQKKSVPAQTPKKIDATAQPAPASASPPAQSPVAAPLPQSPSTLLLPATILSGILMLILGWLALRSRNGPS